MESAGGNIRPLLCDRSINLIVGNSSPHRVLQNRNACGSVKDSARRFDGSSWQRGIPAIANNHGFSRQIAYRARHNGCTEEPGESPTHLRKEILLVSPKTCIACAVKGPSAGSHFEILRISSCRSRSLSWRSPELRCPLYSLCADSQHR